MAKEQLAVIEMITGMILGKTEGISKVDFTPQKTVCPDVIRAGKYLENVGNTTTMNKITESAQKTGNHLPGRTPESQGIHSEHLRKLVQELAESPDTDMHHLMILRHGNIICEVDFAPYRKGIWHITHSMCKSITGMAIGFLVEEEKLKLSESIYQIFPDKGSLWTKMFRPEITVENLLNMTSGVTFNESGIISGNDWLESYLNASVTEKPGTQFQYNSLNSYVLSAIVTERTGMPMDEYLEPRLFGPLGIQNYFWEKCPKGITKGGWGLFMTAEDMAKLGQLYLNKGKWNGIQIIPENWVETSVTKQIESIEGTYGYGYQLWMEERPGSFEYNGMLGQNVLVYPDADMVIVTNAGNEELFQSGKMLDIIRKNFPVGWMPEESLPEDSEEYGKLQHLIWKMADDGQPMRPGKACHRIGNNNLSMAECRDNKRKGERVNIRTLDVETDSRRERESVGFTNAMSENAFAISGCTGIRRGGWNQTFINKTKARKPVQTMRRITRKEHQNPYSESEIMLYNIQKELDGTCYQMEQASVGLFPLVMQVMHNNMTDGIGKIAFRIDEETGDFVLCFQEGEEWKELRTGWDKYIENPLTIHEETYLVAVKGKLSSDADHNPVLIVEIAYLEEAMRRKLYITLYEETGEYTEDPVENMGNTDISEEAGNEDTKNKKNGLFGKIEVRWYETPGKALIMEGMESITTEVTKSPIYTRIRENGGIQLLHRLIEQTIEPIAKGELIV